LKKNDPSTTFSSLLSRGARSALDTSPLRKKLSRKAKNGSVKQQRPAKTISQTPNLINSILFLPSCERWRLAASWPEASGKARQKAKRQASLEVVRKLDRKLSGRAASSRLLKIFWPVEKPSGSRRASLFLNFVVVEA